jgi:hypothetical protein
VLWSRLKFYDRQAKIKKTTLRPNSTFPLSGGINKRIQINTIPDFMIRKEATSNFKLLF